MNRWIKTALATLALAAAAASAQTLTREAPRDVVPGRLVITQPPEGTLDGQPARLSPGARIRDTRNMLVLSGQLAGKETPVVYRRDGLGLVHEVWLLTEAEYTRLGGKTPTAGNAEAVQQFQQALALIFGARR
ncbi:hypothetical protein [Ramlibacter rhizophilus]|uniref:Uncharacterized protein n=1 Tax=Ramlibacter rhizophilus TaxID=1781167 RepID=A0A4Z0BDJ2_9BURK|nr:hypothetical protein [Ramlibacter rhizophilus]TFY97385.1 hypothetical protein EZ242_17825 [Ramlibacter rhizophilus]